MARSKKTPDTKAEMLAPDAEMDIDARETEEKKPSSRKKATFEKKSAEADLDIIAREAEKKKATSEEAVTNEPTEPKKKTTRRNTKKKADTPEYSDGDTPVNRSAENSAEKVTESADSVNAESSIHADIAADNREAAMSESPAEGSIEVVASDTADVEPIQPVGNARKVKKKSKKAETSNLFASVPNADEVQALTPIDPIGEEDLARIEAEAIAALPHTEVEPELLLYESDEIEDTHESAEEAARYEEFLATYKLAMETMRAMAKESEGATQDDESELGNISDFIIDDDEFFDSSDEEDEEEYLTDEEIEAIGTTERLDIALPSYEEYEAAGVGETADEADDEVDEKAIEEIADEVYEEAVKEAAEETVEEIAEEADEEAVEEIAEEADEEAVEEIANQAVVEAVEDAAEDDAKKDDKEPTSESLPDEFSATPKVSGSDNFPDISLREYLPMAEEPEEDTQVKPEDGDGEPEYEDSSEDMSFDEPEQLEMDFGDETEDGDYEDADEPSEPSYNPKKPRFIDTVFDTLELFVFTFALVMLVTTFFVRHSVVDGESMLNTLNDKDIVIISNLLYTPERGDVVVLEDKSVHPTPLIKRVIGVEGDVVEITKGRKVIVNGEILTEDYVYTDFGWQVKPGIWEVGEGEIFVLGDHRNESRDSEEFGTVKADSVLGKVLFRLYPFEEFGGIE